MTMTIGEFVNAKRDLEEALQLAMSIEVSKFTERTGYAPSSIRAEMIDATAYSSPNREYVVGKVDVEVNID